MRVSKIGHVIHVHTITYMCVIYIALPNRIACCIVPCSEVGLHTQLYLFSYICITGWWFGTFFYFSIYWE